MSHVNVGFRDLDPDILGTLFNAAVCGLPSSSGTLYTRQFHRLRYCSWSFWLRLNCLFSLSYWSILFLVPGKEPHDDGPASSLGWRWSNAMSHVNVGFRDLDPDILGKHLGTLFNAAVCGLPSSSGTLYTRQFHRLRYCSWSFWLRLNCLFSLSYWSILFLRSLLFSGIFLISVSKKYPLFSPGHI